MACTESIDDDDPLESEHISANVLIDNHRHYKSDTNPLTSNDGEVASDADADERAAAASVTSTDRDRVDVVALQVFEDPAEKIVTFSPVSGWLIGEPNVVEYELPHGYEEAENDWIGIYRVSALRLMETN